MQGTLSTSILGFWRTTQLTAAAPILPTDDCAFRYVFELET